MKTLMKYLFIATLALLAHSVHADNVNISYVSTDYDMDFPANIVFDDSANGFSVTYGLNINSAVTIDLGYTSLGEAQKSFGFLSTGFDANLVTLAIHHAMPIGSISGHTVKWHALAGIARGDADARIGGFMVSDSDTGLHAGTGFSIWLSPTSAITAMYKRSDLTFSNGATFDYDPKTIEIGYTYAF